MKHRLISLLAAACIAITGACVGAVSDLHSAADEEESVRILALGDSITHGYINGDNGYRKYLCYDLQQQGFTNFDMVGPNNNWTNTATYDYNGTTITYDPAHAGYSGYAIQKMTTMEQRSGILETVFDTTYEDNGVSGNMLEVYDPNIILLQIGTNDVLSAYNDGIAERLENLIDTILPYMDGENDVLFVSTIPDVDVALRYDWLGAYSTVYGLSYWTDPEAFTAKVQESIDSYNSAIQKIVAEKQAAGEKIRFADIHSVVDVETGLYDGVHPNEDGYACMGEYWSEQILNFLDNKPVVTTETTPVVTTVSDTVTEPVTTETETRTTEISSIETTLDTTISAQTTVTETTQLGGLGDVNLDGAVNVADVVSLCQYLLGSQSISKESYQYADMNQDVQVNGFDLTLLRQVLLQKEELQL